MRVKGVVKMSYSYTDVMGGKGNQSIVRFARGTQE